MKFLHIEEARHLNNYEVWIRFNDEMDGEVDLHENLKGPIFEPLKDPDYFKEFKLEGHTLSWPNGADFAPEFIRSVMTQQVAGI